MDQVAFKDVVVTRKGVSEAIRQFDASYPDTNMYDRWLDKGNYKYAPVYGGKRYPCKHILSQASGLDTRNFSGGDETNRVFWQLGFEVVNK